MDSSTKTELNKFLGKATKATYAGGGGKVDQPHRSGFNELEYRDNDWYYRDSYTGFLRSWGQEVVWYKGEPFWTCLYGGGMISENLDHNKAENTFNFLKKVLSTGDKENYFQPRGPKEYIDGDWAYNCSVEGDIEKFRGNEIITYKGEVVFTHDFIGGLVIK